MKRLFSFLLVLVTILVSFQLFGGTINHDHSIQLSKSIFTGITQTNIDNLYLSFFSSERRKMVSNVNDDDPKTTSIAVVTIYSLDGLDVLGPYSVNEGDPLVVEIDEREWDVKIIQQSEGSVVSWEVEE